MKETTIVAVVNHPLLGNTPIKAKPTVKATNTMNSDRTVSRLVTQLTLRKRP